MHIYICITQEVHKRVWNRIPEAQNPIWTFRLLVQVISVESKKSKYTSLFRFSEDSHVDLFFDVTLLHHYWSYCVLCLSRKVVLCGCFFLCIFSLVDHWIAGRKYWPTTDRWTFCHNLHALSTHRHSIYFRKEK